MEPPCKELVAIKPTQVCVTVCLTVVPKPPGHLQAPPSPVAFSKHLTYSLLPSELVLRLPVLLKLFLPSYWPPTTFWHSILMTRFSLVTQTHHYLFELHMFQLLTPCLTLRTYKPPEKDYQWSRGRWAPLRVALPTEMNFFCHPVPSCPTRLTSCLVSFVLSTLRQGRDE